jgi:hypothetical protein
VINLTAERLYKCTAVKMGIIPQDLRLVSHFNLASCRVMPKDWSNHETAAPGFWKVSITEQPIRTTRRSLTHCLQEFSNRLRRSTRQSRNVKTESHKLCYTFMTSRDGRGGRADAD